jgi:glycosyltransferase A (GT-A) superfamily protein (DUF2064 family)
VTEPSGAGTVLVVAKSPVPGLAKTRLAAMVGPAAAADIAAAALLDTLDAAVASGGEVVVALTGDLRRAARRAEVEAALAGVTVTDQSGDGLGARLAHAHAAAHGRAAAAAAVAAADAPVVVFQIGMDTPQVTPRLLADALAAAAEHGAVLGPADDGGWWGLAVAEARLAEVLAGVPMSTDRTYALTRAALESAGAAVHVLPVLRDVDDWADARAVAALGGGRFAAAVAAAGPIHTGSGVEPPA